MAVAVLGDVVAELRSRSRLELDEIFRRLTYDVLEPTRTSRPLLDPISYEIAVHRLTASLREGALTLARTSSSPLVTECGEYMLALYDAHGELAVVHAGVTTHLVGTQGAIKFIRYCFEDDPDGINPGDQFILNDPYLLGQHTPDVLIARPIFDKGGLVAWVGSLTHTLEMGAKDPGGASDTTDIFQEGLRIPCLKLVRGGVVDQHLYRLIGRAVRSPEATLLDTMSKVAGNNVVARRLEEMIEANEAGFLAAVLSKHIQDVEQQAGDILEGIPDGSFRDVYHLDHDGQKSVLSAIRLSLTKEGRKLVFDFEGTGEENPGPINATLPGTIGATYAALISTLFQDLHPNKGVLSCCAFKVPEGCLLNTTYPHPVFAAPAGPMTLLAGLVTKLISQMAMRAGLMDAVCAPWRGNFNSVFQGGYDQHDALVGTLTMDANGGGTGATPFDDGDDTSAFMLAPGSIMSDVEMLEQCYPLLYLYRRQRRDSCGHGRFRGGVGGEVAVAIHNSERWRIGFRGLGTEVTSAHGLFGGYPADGSDVGVVRGVHPERRNAADYRATFDMNGLIAAGDHTQLTCMSPPQPMQHGDVYYLAWTGGGGFGDPLGRPAEMVAIDVAASLISPHAAAAIYGVVLDEDGAVVHEATVDRRKAIRTERLSAAGISCRGSKPLFNPSPPFGDSICLSHRGDERWWACACCGGAIAPEDQDPRSGTAARRVRTPQELGHRRIRADWQRYVEVLCTSCGSLLDVNVVETRALENPSKSGKN